MANSILADVEVSSSATSTGSFATITGMTTGSITAPVGSVIFLEFEGTPDSDATDRVARIRFAEDGSPISGGPIGCMFNDAANETNGTGFGFFVAGDGTNHTYTVEWITHLGTDHLSMNTGITRTLQATRIDNATIEVDVSSTSSDTPTTSFTDMTDMTGTFTVATGAMQIMLASGLMLADASDAHAYLQFAVGGTPEGPIGGTWVDNTDRQATCSLMYAKTGLTGSQTFTLQWDLGQNSPATNTTHARTFQVVEVTQDFSLGVNVSATSTQATPASWADMTSMTGSITPDSSSSVIMTICCGIGEDTADSTSELRLADGGTREGATQWTFMDETAGNPGWMLARAKTGITGSHTMSMMWQQVASVGSTDNVRERRFQVIDFEVAGGASSITADAGSYAWTGQTANLLYNSLISAESGSYAWTGQVVNLEYHAVLSAESGSYAWTGQVANLEYHAVISAESGSYAWTGQDATLTHVTASTLDAESGSYVWTGQTVNLLYNALVSAESGSYAWTGQDATLSAASLLSAEAGSYAWTGQTVNLLYNAVLSAVAGSYVWTGQDTTLTLVPLGIWTKQTPGSTSWSDASAGSTIWTDDTPGSTGWSDA